MTTTFPHPCILPTFLLPTRLATNPQHKRKHTYFSSHNHHN
ncbi:hypothetical protein P4N68_11920 [Corynebacterium felinum]|uniref:Uncharacterized protein n=1 Tax=Corynebacterium felinum TaxID=131318 RepID=A0ABU2B9Z8_9CORY|nr:hypothetical protein [Corynebacterium felinum]MDF5821775.1 hypothetical protein [Corynebacterium felinum]MDR7355418.1 hypothetical protein [Corynebacterium felinum]